MRHFALATGLALVVSSWAAAQTSPSSGQPAADPAQNPGTQPAGTQATETQSTRTQSPMSPTAAPAPAQAPPAGGQFPAPGQVMPELHVEPVRPPVSVPGYPPDALRPSSLDVTSGPQTSPQLRQRERYHIHEGDQLLVEFTYTPEFNQTLTVQPDGFITLRVGGSVRIAGRTLDEVKSLVENSASVRLNDPVVVLTLVDFQHPYFVVAGEALTPMKYELREHLTVLQGLMLAGGIRPSGKEKQVVLIHGLGTADEQISLLDLKDVTSSKIFEHDMDLSAGDIIFVPRNKLTHAIQVMSLINSPAGYANSAIYAFR